MNIPTEPIGSIPRPLRLIEALATRDGTDPALDPLYDEAIRDTIARFEATGSPVITDGEQTKPSFATYPIHGLDNLAPDGVTIPFADGHTRQLPRLTAVNLDYNSIGAEGHSGREKQRLAQNHAVRLLHIRHDLCLFVALAARKAGKGQGRGH